MSTKTRVELLIKSQVLNPEEIEAMLGVAADETIWQGRPRPGSRVPRPWRAHEVLFREGVQNPELGISSSLEVLFDRVAALEAEISEIVKHGCSIQLSIVQVVLDGNASIGSFVLDESWTRLLGKNRGSLSIDLYSADGTAA